MVQSSDARPRDDLPIFSRFDDPFFRSILFKPEMGSARVVVGDVRPDHDPKLALIDHDHMIQTVPS